MRFTAAGILLLSLAAAALGQAEGEVESIGFDGHYRPNACIPMKLRLRSTVGTPQTYKLAVLQEDMDGDRVLYSRPFTLNGNPEGARIEERVWVYFMPQPRELRASLTPREMTNIIRIFLCTPGGKQLVQIKFLPGCPQLKNLDQPTQMMGSRGTRLILMVGTSQSRPFRTVYEFARGVLEDVLFQPMSLNDLPENVLGYEAADAIVWLDADPTAMKPETAAAVQEYVRNGGRLVVCQNAQTWRKMLDSDLRDLLPVVPTGVADEKGLLSLRKLADVQPTKHVDPVTKKETPLDPWADKADAVAPIVRAEVRRAPDGQIDPRVFVNMWQASDPSSPYLARWIYGLGTVAWVAQDFGDPSVLSTTVQRHTGWQRIWDRTFDWRNDTITVDMARAGVNKENYERKYRDVNYASDLSAPMLRGMDSPKRGAALVALAVVFFIGYWLLAGPGSYFFLLAKKKSHYSWVAYAASAMAATALTVLVVQLVLRGPPELHHVSFVRVGPDGQALIQSQFGLYIKRDGMQRIELRETDSKQTSYLIPYPAHPAQLGDTGGFMAYLEYDVPMRDRSSGESPAINVPFRSTMKKLKAQWVGTFPGAIVGRARLADSGLSGKLTNKTGMDLRSVYLVYVPSPSQRKREDDAMITIPDSGTGPTWPKDTSLDLGALMAQAGILGMESGKKEGVPVRGLLNTGWMNKDHWGGSFLRQMTAGSYNDAVQGAILMSVFDRLAPSQGANRENVYDDRYELLRRSGRRFDASGAVSCGQLLVVARSMDGAPLPFPLHVEGRSVAGQGVTCFQFIVPLDRSGSATQPAEENENSTDG